MNSNARYSNCLHETLSLGFMAADFKNQNKSNIVNTLNTVQGKIVVNILSHEFVFSYPLL